MQVILHVGMGKTGSSAIQSLLSLNREQMSQCGICYPNTTPANDERAKSLKATAGNGLALGQILLEKSLADDGAGAVTDYVGQFVVGDHQGIDRVLFSSEKLFKPVASSARLILRCMERGLDFQVICYVRDVIPHAWADYAQVVKGSTEIRSFEEFIHNYRYPHITIRTLKSDLNSSIYSYEGVMENRGGIVDHFWSLLGCLEILRRSGCSEVNVNRTLAPARVRFKQFLNHYLSDRFETPSGRRLMSELGYAFAVNESASEHHIHSALYRDFSDKYLDVIGAMKREACLQSGSVRLISDRWIIAGDHNDASLLEDELNVVSALISDQTVQSLAVLLKVELSNVFQIYRKWLSQQSIFIW